MTVYAALGGTIKAEPVWATLGNVTLTLTMASGTGRFVAVYLPVAATLTGVKWFQSVQGVYTSNNYNGVGLYTYSEGTLTLVASSTNDGNIWKGTGNTFTSKAFSSTYAAAAGVYFVCALYSNFCTNYSTYDWCRGKRGKWQIFYWQILLIVQN